MRSIFPSQFAGFPKFALLSGIGCFCLLSGIWARSLDESVSQNWHQWRGPEANGVSRTATPPLEWSEDRNLQWKVKIDGQGVSSPIVWEDKVFLLTAVDTGIVNPSLPKPEEQPKRIFGITHPNTEYEFVVLCLDRASGKERWRRTAARKIPHQGHHGDNSFASASPVTDGERLYCWFGSAGLFCYDLDGAKSWERDLGKAFVGASLGEGGSPAWHNGRLVIVRDQQRQSSIETLNAATGETIWKIKRNEDNAWTTPKIIEHNGSTQVIVNGSNAVCSYDLDSGKIIWQCSGLTDNPIPSPVAEGGRVYCMTGYRGHALLALPLSATGDISESDAVLWRKNRGTPYVPSPLLFDGLLCFNQSNQALWSCVDAQSGKVYIDRQRLPGLSNLYASPVAAAGRIYITDRSGKTLVLEQSKKLKVLATNKLDDSVDASPALAGNQIFLRGRRFLYALASSPVRQVDDNGQKPLAALPAHWDKDNLSKAESQTAIDLLWADYRQRLAAKRADEIKTQSIQIGDKTLRYLEKAFGRAPEGERSLWISMHGGGGAPPEVNDSQWKNQIQLYQPPEGFYVAPRAPTDTWNLWHQPHIDGLFDRLIENYTAARGVNPNRVYLMGYSAGGDGVYQLATRMADRWAAASMMAGHPNDAQPDNLRNIGFGLFVGGKDSAYKRNQIAAKWKNLLFNLRQNDPNGYPHLVRIYPEMGHWMNRKDAEALPWMSQFRRDPWPKKIIWRQAKGLTSRFYWLKIPKQHLAKDQRLTAEVDDQTIRITAENTPQLIVRLSDALVNLDHPITVIVNGKEQFRGKVNRSAREIVQSLQQRADPSSASPASITINL